MAAYPNGSTIDLTSPVTAARWDKLTNSLFYDTLEFKDLAGKELNSVIYQPSKLSGKAGVTTTVQITDLTKNFYSYNNSVTLLKEGVLPYFTDSVKLDEVAHTYAIGDIASVDRQAIALDQLKTAQESNNTKLNVWFTASFFAQLSGTASTEIPEANGFNGLVKPTNTVSGEINPTLIANALAMAKRMRFQKATNLVTGSNFVLYLSPEDEAGFRSALDSQTFDLSKAIAIADKDSERLSQDVLGAYYGVELRSNYYVPKGKAYFLGGQAVIMTPGEEYEGNYIKNVTYDIDGTHLGLKTRSVIGMKKTQYDGKDFGVIELTITPPASANGTNFKK